MACRPGKIGRLENLRRPARVICVVVAVGLMVGSFIVRPSTAAILTTAAGAAVLVVVLLLPVMTEFEVDVIVVRAKANLPTRAQNLEATCRRECRRVASFVSLVGVQADQVDQLVELAIEDTCRLLRGPVRDDLVGRLLVCRAANLIQGSLRLGGPFRVLSPQSDGEHRPEWAAFAALDPHDRLIVAMVEWLELDAANVAAILDLDVQTVEQTLRWDLVSRVGGGSS